jgi:hypothetical protein
LTASRHAADENGNVGIRHGPTLLVIRFLLRLVIRNKDSGVLRFVDAEVFAVGNGAPVEAELFRLANAIAVAVWAIIAVGVTFAVILAHAIGGNTHLSQLLSLPGWALAYGSCACAAVWALRACWWICERGGVWGTD